MVGGIIASIYVCCMIMCVYEGGVNWLCTFFEENFTVFSGDIGVEDIAHF